MSKKIIILIIILIIIIIGFFGYSYIKKPNEIINKDTIDIGENFISKFFNFGEIKTKNPETEENNPVDISNENEGEITNTQQGELFKISSMPIAGFTIFTKERFLEIPNPKELTENNISITNTEEKTTENKENTIKTENKKEQKIIPSSPPTEIISALRYVDKTSGNIYQSFIDEIKEIKFSNMKIENIYETYFGNNGDTVLARFIKGSPFLGGEIIMTYSGTLPKEILGNDSVGENNINGSFLPENIIDMSVSPNTSKIFYLFKTKDGVLGTTAFSSGENKIQVFDSKYTEWLSEWPNENTITITTKPASFVPGFMYIINPNKKDLKKILSGINGLTTLTSPNGNLVLYSNNNVSLNVYNIQTKEVTSFPVKSLPEKCVWNLSSEIVYCAVPKLVNSLFSYPDAWYKGEVSFSDDIWKLDMSFGNAKIIFNINQDIDGIKLKLDKEENNLFFVNKKDSYLWGLRLK